MKRHLSSTGVVLGLLALFAAGPSGDASSQVWQGNAVKAVQGADAGQRPSGLLPSWAVQSAVADASAQVGNASGSLPALPPGSKALRCGHVAREQGRLDNVRTVQICDYRRQTSPVVAANPANGGSVVVGRSDNHLGALGGAVAYSFDGGRRFADYDVPSARVACSGCGNAGWTYEATSGPSLAWGPDGELYALTVGFDVQRDGYSGLWVLKSNPGLRGSYLHSPDTSGLGAAAQLGTAPVGLVHDNMDDPTKLDDQGTVVVDTAAGSSFKGAVYAVWSIFDYSCGRSGAAYCSSPVFFSRSTDGGATWNDGRVGRPGPPVEISGNNAAVCGLGDAFDRNRDPADCDFDRAPAAAVGPDGAVHVVFDNCNTTAEGAEGLPAVCQLLTVSSTDGGVTWTAPAKVGDDHRTEPMNGVSGAIGNGCPMFRQCLPAQGYAISSAPSIAVDPNTGTLAVFWSDFRNGRFTTDGSENVSCSPCNEDVFAATSNDGGVTWSGTIQVTTARSAQYGAWGTIDETGALRVGYYTRQYGDCERSGCQDVRLSSSRDGGSTWTGRRITTSSMPNLAPDSNPVQQGFLADHVSVAAGRGSVEVAWTDTRGLNGVVDEDVVFARLPVA